MMPEAAPANATEPKRGGRWLKPLLVVSLGLNLLLLGTAVGTHFMMRHAPPWGGSMGANMIGFAGSLPAERRRELWRATAEQRKGLWQHWREVGKARREASTALLADPFDQQRFAAAQARLQEAETKARSASQPLIVELARNLTSEERRKLLSRRDERRARRGPGRGWMADMEHEALEQDQSSPPPSANSARQRQDPAVKE